MNRFLTKILLGLPFLLIVFTVSNTHVFGLSDNTVNTTLYELFPTDSAIFTDGSTVCSERLCFEVDDEWQEEWQDEWQEEWQTTTDAITHNTFTVYVFDSLSTSDNKISSDAHFSDSTEVHAYRSLVSVCSSVEATTTHFILGIFRCLT